MQNKNVTMTKGHSFNKTQLADALSCLEDNGVTRKDAPKVLQKLCYMLFFEEIGKKQVQDSLNCLEENGIDGDETRTVLQALCYIILDAEVEDLLW